MRAREFIDEIRFEKSDQPFSGMTGDMDREYMPIGSGSYSRIYQHPTQNKTLIKVFANDLGYAKWLRWIAANQNNRYVPRIIPHDDSSIIKAYKHFKPLPGNQAVSQRIGIVNLEKLHIATREQIDTFITYVLEYVDDQTREKIKRKNPERYSLNWFDRFDEEAWKQVARNSRGRDADLSAVATEFVRLIDRHFYLDLHNENLMWDPQRNNIVFIDVLSVG